MKVSEAARVSVPALTVTGPVRRLDGVQFGVPALPGINAWASTLYAALPLAGGAYAVPEALKVPTSGLLAGTFRRYVAHAVRAGQLASRSVAMVGVDSPNSGTVTSTGAPPGGVAVCRALRAMSAPVAPPSAVVTNPSIAPGSVRIATAFSTSSIVKTAP